MDTNDDREQFVAQIVEDSTGNVVRQSAPTYKRRAESIEDGMLINLNHDNYSTRVVPASEAVAEIA
jgi:hypothetical protein